MPPFPSSPLCDCFGYKATCAGCKGRVVKFVSNECDDDGQLLPKPRYRFICISCQNQTDTLHARLYTEFQIPEIAAAVNHQLRPEVTTHLLECLSLPYYRPEDWPTLLLHPAYTTGGQTRLTSESSAIGDYEDSYSHPGSSFLWIGDNHHLDREEVATLITHLQYWLDNRRLKEDQP